MPPPVPSSPSTRWPYLMCPQSHVPPISCTHSLLPQPPIPFFSQSPCARYGSTSPEQASSISHGPSPTIIPIQLSLPLKNILFSLQNGQLFFMSDDTVLLSRFVTCLRESGITVTVVSVGSTPTCSVPLTPHLVTVCSSPPRPRPSCHFEIYGCKRTNTRPLHTHRHPLHTCRLSPATFSPSQEMHPGNYVFYDRQQLHTGTVTRDQVRVAGATHTLPPYSLSLFNLLKYFKSKIIDSWF